MSRMTALERADWFESELRTAASAGVDDRLAAMLSDPGLNRWEHTKVAAELGQSRGNAGSVALRQAFGTATAGLAAASKSTRAEYRDLVCACVIALARRDGLAATDVFVATIGSPNAFVRDYGMSALAPVGDDRAWEQVMARLDEILRRKISPGGLRDGEALLAIEYLARHAGPGSDRAIRLITLVRRRWRNLPDPELIQQRYRGIQPDGRPAQDLNLPAGHTPRPWWSGGRLLSPHQYLTGQ